MDSFFMLLFFGASEPTSEANIEDLEIQDDSPRATGGNCVVA